MANKSKSWRIFNGLSYQSCEDATRALPAAHYELRSNHSTGVYLNKSELKSDDLVADIDPVSKKVIDEIKQFWGRKENFARLGMLWKRGFFFWGPPGGGKSSLVTLICKFVIEHGGISVSGSYPNMILDGLKMIRELEPDRPMVLILEDLDDMFREYSESSILNILDGENQVDNIIILATANSPERLEKRVLNRPGRFDFVYRVGLPNSASRRDYILSKAPEMAQRKDELEQWVKDTKGLSIAHLRDLLIAVLGMGHSYKEAIDKLYEMNSKQPDSYTEPDAEEDRPPFGFCPPSSSDRLDLEVRVTEPSIMIEDD